MMMSENAVGGDGTNVRPRYVSSRRESSVLDEVIKVKSEDGGYDFSSKA